MGKIQWSYHRNGCKTCGKTQAFLAEIDRGPDEQVDARKVRLQADEALALAREVNEIYATRGQKVIHLDMKKDKPDDETLDQAVDRSQRQPARPDVAQRQDLDRGLRRSDVRETAQRATIRFG